jgi:hypothetical protein
MCVRRHGEVGCAPSTGNAYLAEPLDFLIKKLDLSCKHSTTRLLPIRKRVCRECDVMMARSSIDLLPRRPRVETFLPQPSQASRIRAVGPAKLRGGAHRRDLAV